MAAYSGSAIAAFSHHIAIQLGNGKKTDDVHVPMVLQFKYKG
jgi:hypothetical protein